MWFNSLATSGLSWTAASAGNTRDGSLKQSRRAWSRWNSLVLDDRPFLWVLSPQALGTEEADSPLPFTTTSTYSICFCLWNAMSVWTHCFSLSLLRWTKSPDRPQLPGNKYPLVPIVMWSQLCQFLQIPWSKSTEDKEKFWTNIPRLNKLRY